MAKDPYDVDDVVVENRTWQPLRDFGRSCASCSTRQAQIKEQLRTVHDQNEDLSQTTVSQIPAFVAATELAMNKVHS